jgi:type III restriction enzyme
LRRKAADITREVKKALEDEGYEGDVTSVVDRSEEGGKPGQKHESNMRREFRAYYRQFDGKVYLPRFCVRQNGECEALDYFRHLISAVDVAKFDYDSVDWNVSDELAKAKDSFYRLTIGQKELENVEEREIETFESDERVKSWLISSLPFDYFSHRQMSEVTEDSINQLYKANKEIKDRLDLVKFIIRDKVSGLIERETDRQTQERFEHLFKNKQLCFYLECVEARFEIPPKIEVLATRRLLRDDNEPLERSLFDFVPNDMNEYEKSVALYMDNHPEVLWWYRNLVGPENFSIQGYRRNKIYPDFVVQQGHAKKPIASVIVVESKGKHLKGSEDTKYKRTVADYFEKVGHKVPWQKLAAGFKDNTFRFQVLDEGEYSDRDWRTDLRKILEEAVN